MACYCGHDESEHRPTKYFVAGCTICACPMYDERGPSEEE